MCMPVAEISHAPSRTFVDPCDVIVLPPVVRTERRGSAPGEGPGADRRHDDDLFSLGFDPAHEHAARLERTALLGVVLDALERVGR